MSTESASSERPHDDPVGLATTAWRSGRDGAVALAARSELPDGVDAIVVPVLRRAGEGDRSAVVALAPGRQLSQRLAGRSELVGPAGAGLVHAPEDESEPLLVLVSLGTEAEIGRQALRLAGAAAWRRLGACEEAVVDLRGIGELADRLAPAEPAGAAGELGPRNVPGDLVPQLVPPVAALVQAFVEGLLLASYHFAGYVAAAGDRAALRGAGEDGAAAGAGPQRLVVVCDESGAAELGLERAVTVASAVALARDLVNTPAGDCPPERLAEAARVLGEEAGLAVEVIDAAAAAAAGLGGLLGVGRGSHNPPVLVRLRYEPEVDAGPAGRPLVALVGKGITFDSGGLSLKPATAMMTMKTDMSGAAAVLSTMLACGRLGIDKSVVGYLPLAENMPGGGATRPGDVLRARNGTTIEVLNTDAEGRLVLADALGLAVEDGPDAIVDLATLTGACVTALGRRIAGLMGSDASLLDALEQASMRSGEALWRLPLPSSYRSQLDSEVADMKNIGNPGEAGALVAGLFLEAFTGGLPWAHLDIAGPARSEQDEGYEHKGATGFGVRTLIELLEAPIVTRQTPGSQPTALGPDSA